MLKKWAEEEKLAQRILTYGREVNELYGLESSVPATVWINPEGVIVKTGWGELGSATLEANTQRLLGGG